MLFGFPLRQKALFFRQLSTMVTAAMSLDRAVTTAGTGTLPQAPAMARSILSGNSLSQVMAGYPLLFGEYEVQIVRIGESSGSLDTQLAILADELERGYQLRSSLLGKLVYPIFVAHMAVFIPPLVVLVQSGPEAYLRLTLGMLVPIYLLLGLVALLYRFTSTVGPFRSLVDHTLAWVPVLGSVLKLLALTRMVRSLSHLIEAGALPYHAFQLSAATCGNRWVSGRCLSAFQRLGQDRKLSEWMQATGLFSPAVLGLVGSGEETGQPGRMLAKAAELLELEYRSKLHLVVTLLPVFMLLGVGLLVGIRVYALMQSYIKLLEL